MIGQVVRGNSMPDLISYLFGPGKQNEHLNQHLVAGYADAVFSADDRLWQQEPGKQRSLRNPARTLGHELDFPQARWQTEIANGYVWHCSLSLKHTEGQLTDEQWTEAAHEVVQALGFDGGDGKSPCRWVAVRHGLSAAGNDHIHIAVNLVREDGTKASTWNDFRKLGRVCADLEDRFGLQHVPGRMTGRTLPEPSRADREISAARGDPEPLRVRLERKVRACAAIATSEDHFTRIARDNGLLIRPRYNLDGTAITGYAFADHTARRSGTGPIWFGGGKLAPDLTVSGLRRRWEQTATHQLTRAADLTAAAAVSAEPTAPGGLSAAARHLARAAQEPVVMMAETFIALTASTAPELQLFHELDALITACLATASTATARQHIAEASTLVRATAEDLSHQADQQARDALENIMTDPSHEEELLDHLTRAAALGANLVRTALKPAGQDALAKKAEALRKAGYTETTPYDGTLRGLFGEHRWAMYASDPVRILAAAAITDAANAGHDIPAMLTRVVNKRAWENDDTSAARSIAAVLAYRIEKDAAAQARRRTLAPVPAARVPSADITTHPRSTGPQAATAFDAHLENLLGEHQWRQYAEDPRRADIAEMITQAAAEGRDVPALLSEAVASRELDGVRRVAGVLHYRLQKAMKLPPETEDRLARAHATAPAGEHKNTTRPAQVRPTSAAQRPNDGRDL
jgi:hypothetical protein